MKKETGEGILAIATIIIVPIVLGAVGLAYIGILSSGTATSVVGAVVGLSFIVRHYCEK